MIYLRKKSWKGNAAMAVNERKEGQRFIEKTSQKKCRVCPNRPRTWCLICKIALCMDHALKPFIRTELC